MARYAPEDRSCPHEIDISYTSLLDNFFLDSLRILEQLRQLALLRLQVRVAAHVLLVDEDVRDGSLLGHLLQGVLDVCAVV